MIERFPRKEKLEETVKPADPAGWGQPLSGIQVRHAPLADLTDVLARLVDNLSLERARIAMDQLKGALASKSLDKVVFVTAANESQPETPIAAAIAVQQFSADTRQAGDMATMVHAGMLEREAGGNGETAHEQIMQAMSSAVDERLYDQGTRFLQWPTEPSDRPDDEVARWCHGFAFQSVGTLEYLGGPAELPPDSPLLAADERTVHFQPIDWDGDGELGRFAELVERTYQETLDCPSLADFRTAAQTLSGYQTSAGFAPQHWYTVTDEGAPVGCLVLAVHRTEPQEEESAAVVEIAYMGLVPEARGRGLGRRLVRHACEVAQEIGATRLILAVDRQNEPARVLYEQAGLKRILRETVWVKSLCGAE